MDEPTTNRGDYGLALALAGVLLVLFVTVGQGVQLMNAGFGLWFTEIFLFFGTTWLALRLTRREPIAYTGLGVSAPLSLGLAFLAGAFNFFAVVVPLQALSQHLLPPGWIELFDASRLFEKQLPLELALIISAVAVAAPICEEFFFRGVLLKGFVSGGSSRVTALFATATIFSLFHLDPVGFLARLELGLLFGWLYLRAGSLWPAILAHAANNLVSTVLYFSFEGSGEAEADPQLAAVAALAAIFVLPLVFTLRWFRSRAPMLSAPPQGAPRPLGPREALSWFGAAVVSLALLLALDWRGVALNFTDLSAPYPIGMKQPPAEHADEVEAVEQLRARARRGEVDLAEYTRARRAMSAALKEHRDALPPPTPPPVPLPPT